MKARRKVILACVLVTLGFGLLFSLYGYDRTWRLWNIPTMSPHFADLRAITGGAESYAQGFDPMIENPGDPWQRRLNYPRVWQNLYLIGVNQSHTTYIGISLIFLFLASICLLLPHASNIMIVLVMAAVLSPATLLGVERGNIDLLMFFLVTISVVAIKRWHLLSASAVLLGFVLKLYPIFGGAILLRTTRSMFLRYVLIFVAFIAIYIFLTYSDISLIRAATPRDISLSYGLNVFWMKAMKFNQTLGSYARVLSYLIVLLALWFAFTSLLRGDFLPESHHGAEYLDAFRAGTAIYLGTFLLGNNFDYRLMFLILTIPQLVLWIKCYIRDISLGSMVIVSFIFISQWYLLINKITHHLPHGGYVSFVLDELSSWGVFVGLLYLFFWSMPDWVKRYAQKKYFLTRGST
ncbi:MAG: hypothetical protein ABSC45_04360 [Desulfobaccales bacterium]|jgi:hypothetical protein